MLPSYRPISRACAVLACGTFALSLPAQTATISVADRLTRLESELSELRQENQVLRQQVGALEPIARSAPAAPAASPALRLGGELRLRYETFHSDNAAFVDRQRPRLRLRFGGVADVSNTVETGLRLTTGVSEGEPTGNNATFQDNASKKAFALDLAYVKWTPVKTATASLSFTGGKMNSPLTSSDFVLDGDYTPEGFAAQYSYMITKGQILRVNAAQFVLDEISTSSHDPMLYVGQVRLDSAWSGNFGTSVGFTQLDISNASRLTSAAVPDVHKGNTRTAAGVLVNQYRPYLFDVALLRTFGPVAGFSNGLPVKLTADYMINPGADTENRAYQSGLFFGKAGKAGTWEFSYRYRVAQADCWYEELIDSDSGAFYQSAPTGGSVGYGGGTNVRGHIFAGNYALTDYATVGFTYFATRLINPFPAGSDSSMGRLQLNTILKF